MKRQESQDRGRETGVRRRRGRAPRALGLCLTAVLCLTVAAPVSAEDMTLKLIETKRVELREKEEALKREEEQLAAIRKEVDAKIAAYTKLLAEMEVAVKKIEAARDVKLTGVVKAYEAMPAEDAAVRLSALEKKTALQIMSRMKSKKAGAIMALMEPQKAASLTKDMTKLAAKSPK